VSPWGSAPPRPTHERIIGLLVRLPPRRFTLQERLGEQIADAFGALMEPHAIAVDIEAVHARVREERPKTVTSVWRGGYSARADVRSGFLAAVRGRGSWK
jgi:GTP cyclohydrolase I